MTLFMHTTGFVYTLASEKITRHQKLHWPFFIFPPSLASSPDDTHDIYASCLKLSGFQVCFSRACAREVAM